jgi:large subunit ribosomal protein L4e
VSRIPRVSGGGTNRSGQGAFGNMCRKGRMFAPTKVWRKWHRKVNVNQRRYALVSAVAASAVPALVQARGHKIEAVPEVPLVVSGLEALTKTKAALAALEALGAGADLERVKESRVLRAGKGKMRSRRYVVRRGPLVVHAGPASLEHALRNLPGVDTVHVERLNLLQLAPGGHLGRFVIWTAEAFAALPGLYGSVTEAAAKKVGYTLPRSAMANADLGRLINSSEVQAVVRPAIKSRRWASQKKNPLSNHTAMVRLNPYAAVVRKSEATAQAARAAKKTKRTGGTRTSAKLRAASKAKFAAIRNDDFARPQ